MGKYFFDHYSISHMIGGMILQRMNISFIHANLLHLFFEIFENKFYVKYFGGRCIKIDHLLPIRDCKTISDTNLNIIGDQFFFILGYLLMTKISKQNVSYLPKISLLSLPFIPPILSLITTNIIGRTPKYEINQYSDKYSDPL